MPKNILLETTVPFHGFYNSIHDHALNDAHENLVSNDRGDSNSKLLDMIDIDWKGAFQDYAKKFTEELGSLIELDLKFKDLCSPKYYNFSTDRIFAEISLDDVENMFKTIKKEELQNLIKQKFTSCDGFISSYDNKLDLWPKDLEEWDHNQIGTLLELYATQYTEDLDYKILSLLDDAPYSIIDKNLKMTEETERALNIAHYLRERQNRKYR